MIETELKGGRNVYAKTSGNVLLRGGNAECVCMPETAL